MKKSVLFKAKFEDESLPPPFKHTYSIAVTPVNDGVEIDYDLKYLERESIDENEIYTEGFTLDDDFSWKGKLNLIWKNYLEDFFHNSTFKEKLSKNSIITVEVGEAKSKSPENLDDWQYVLQELTQAIFEVAGRETLLEINYMEITKESTYKNNVVISFADRNMSIIYESDGNVKRINKDWKESKKLMQVVYSLDYLIEKAKPELPKKPGKYINVGEGVWYELGISVVNPGKKNNLLAQLEKVFKSPSGHS